MDDEGRLTLITWPARGRPRITVALIAYAVIFAVLGGLFLAGGTRSSAAPFAVLAVMAGVVLSLARWFFPTEYRLGGNTIEVRFLGTSRKVPWTRFRSWRRERGGFFLSPYSDASRFDRLRGLFILVDNSTVAENAHDSAPETPEPDGAANHLTAMLEEKIGESHAPRLGP